MPHTSRPTARLLIETGCSHCTAAIGALTRLIKAGKLARLEIVNLSVSPRDDWDADVHSVPVAQIGPFCLDGALSARELSDWVDAVAGGGGWTAYYVHLLERQRIDEVVRRVREQRSCLVELLNLLTSADTSTATRIGIGAVAEELSGSTELRAVIPDLEQLTLSEAHQTRADACHFLGLTGDPKVIPAVRRLLDDEQPDVCEIAMETLAMLGDDE